MINSIIAVVCTVADNDSTSTPHLSFLYAAVKTRAKPAPMADASVGVAKPKYIEPRTNRII